jgi:hypothetical protein
MFELSKRKGSLCLVVLLSLGLGACASRQPGSARQEGAPPLDGGSEQTDGGWPDAATIVETDAGAPLVSKVRIKTGGALTMEVTSSEPCICFGSVDGGPLDGGPFNDAGTCINVPVNGGVTMPVNNTQANYTFWFTDSSDAGQCQSPRPPSDGDLDTGATGTLEVGPGDGQEPPRPAR